tara:strand:- start:64 stop:399 length:336 start_codon:yes stop_codon:yes gene_type:complete
LRAGDLRHSVIIQTPTLTQDAVGGQDTSWATHATVWAELKPISGQEYLDPRSVQAEVSHQVRIRYLSTVTPDMRLLYGARVFEIVAVMDVDTRGREMLLNCKEDITSAGPA